MTDPELAVATNGTSAVPTPAPGSFSAPQTAPPAGGFQPPAVHVGSHPDAGPSAPGASPGLRVLVRRADNAPVAAAAVALLDSGGHQVGRAETDTSGVAGFPSVPVGEFLLVVRQDGFLPQARTVLIGTPPAPAPEVEFHLSGAARIGGTVTTGTGRAVEGALVTLTGADGAVAGSTRTNAAGWYELIDLTVDAGTLAVFAPSADPLAIPVSVRTGTRVRQDVEVRGNGSISGVARTPEGWLIADARVSLHVDGVEVAVTRTDADGAYSFAGLDAGTYTVRAVGYPPAQTESSAGAGDTVASPITLAHQM